MNRIHDVDFTDAEVREFIAKQESGDVLPGSAFKDRMVAALEEPVTWGWRLPWEKAEERLRLRPAEVSLWAGMGGHLKSALLQQIAFWQAKERKVGIQSFEMPIDQSLARACRQCAGNTSPGRRFIDTFADWMSDRVWFYDRLDSVPPENVLGCTLHMARDLGIELVVIDCLIKIKGLTREATLESAFMDQLMAMAKTLKIHIALVHHIRKPDKMGDAYRPNKYDIRGAGDLVDQASTVCLVWHDKKRQRLKEKRSQGVALEQKEEDYLEKSMDLILHCCKQRNAPWEGYMGFYVHDSMQISDHPIRRLGFLEQRHVAA